MTLFEIFGALVATIAALGYVNHRFIRLPDTIGIMAAGMVLSVILALVGVRYPAAIAWAQKFSEQIDFSEAVLHGLLGVLLFAGALHINISDLSKQKWSVLMLATVGVIISTMIVGYGMYFMMGWMGINLKLVHCLMFGALISPTDPIAVIDVLKRAGAPENLELQISGESLFNDGTAVIAYLLFATLAGTGEAISVQSVMKLMMFEVGGGIVFGLGLGYVAYAMLKGMDSYPVEIMVTLALATGGYALTEHFHASAPLAVVIMGLVIGNQGANRAMSEKTREHLFSFWDLLDEVLNLVLFGLIGIKILSLADSEVAWHAAFMAIPLVLVARFVSVCIPIMAMNPWIRKEPNSIRILTWGGLRGGISIALALSMPEISGKPFIVVATYLVVLFSLLVQAPTLNFLLRKSKT